VLLISLFFALAFTALTGIGAVFLVVSNDRPEQHPLSSFLLTVSLLFTFAGAVISLAAYGTGVP
jgi:hypothetical protein